MIEADTGAPGSHDTVIEDVDLGSGEPYRVVLIQEFGVVAAGNGKRVIMDPGLGVDDIRVGIVYPDGMTQEYSGLTGIPPVPEADNPANVQGTDPLSSDLSKDGQ